jgi:hypothetical protein
MAEIYNINVDAGTTYKVQVAWKNQDQTAINLTGFTGRMQIRKSYNSPTVLLDLNTSNGGIVITDAAGGLFEIRLTPNQTTSLTDGVFDVEMVSASGEITRIIQGMVKVSPEVTR